MREKERSKNKRHQSLDSHSMMTVSLVKRQKCRRLRMHVVKGRLTHRVLLAQHECMCVCYEK